MGTRDRAQVSSGGVGPPRGGGSGLSHGGWLTQQGLDDVVPGGIATPWHDSLPRVSPGFGRVDSECYGQGADAE